MFDSITRILTYFNLIPDFLSATGIFCAIAWFATAMAVLVSVFSFFSDGGDDISSAGEAGGGHEAGWLSLRSLTGFLLGFGWTGFVLSQAGGTVGESVIGGIIGGVAMFFLIVFLMRMIYSLRSDGTLKYDSLVGMSALVYVTIPPHGESGGQVKVAHPSQLFFLPAVQSGDVPLSADTPVKITAVHAGVLTVSPL